MRLATAEQMKIIDSLAQKKYDLSSEILMESAGALSAREIEIAFYHELRKKRPISVICGPGNNGGDGLVLARHLHAIGFRNLQVFINSTFTSPLAKKQLKRWTHIGGKTFFLNESPDKKNLIKNSSLIVDAIYGIGLNRQIDDSSLIQTINTTQCPVVSLDVPSGLDANTGQTKGACVHAEMTLTYGLAKPGFFVSEGPKYVGRLRVLPIGFPHELLRSEANSHFAFTEKLVRRFLPQRQPTANKSHFGHLLVVAGRPGFWGAGILAASSGFRLGAGYVTWASFDEPQPTFETPEFLNATIDESLKNPKISAIAVGPGLGVHEKTAILIERLKQEKRSRVILDADALIACALYKLFPLPESWILTPHTGELGKILNCSSRDIEQDRYNSALEAAKKAQCWVLLKGFHSILATPDRRTLVIPTGNVALAKAGTGDVLTGFIGSLLAQGVAPLGSAALAAFIHGRMADEWIRQGNDPSALVASDLRDLVAPLLQRIRDGFVFL